MKQDVLIVGGGPTGMTLALQLHRYGVPFRIIEKRRPEPSPSKALSINPASLQLLNDFGLAESLVELGHKTEVINLLYHNRALTRSRFSRLQHKYPFFLMLPQPETERVLEDRLNALGYQIERDCELLGLDQHNDRVRVTLRNGARQDTAEFAYVAGCDGGLSKVRESLGLSFAGYDYRMHFLLADLRIRWPGRQEEGHYFVRDDGFLILLPLKSGYHRIVIKAEAECPPGYKPSLEEMRAYIARYQIEGLQVEDPIWLSSAPFYNRSAPTFQQGRVFIAGDAAHLFSPIGGFGMNSGIADAFNLGWKLGYCLNGCGSDALLDSYNAERHLNSAKLLGKTDRSTSLIARLDRHQSSDEQAFLPRMHNRDFLRLFPWESSGLNLAYGPADAPPLPGQALQPGRQLPYVADNGVGGDSLALLGGGRHSLFLVPPRDAAGLHACLALIAQVQQVCQDRIRVRLLTDASHDRLALPSELCLRDERQHLRHAYALAEGDFVLVRPDLYVAQSGQLQHSATLWDRLQRLHGFTAAQPSARLAG
ncbi:2-polyprenyl-6-methoxyphenol hydroxylase-like FAD-dependent oxidoreductase [Pseudomonas sp. SJZ079]|uniref:FAD-dependent monooxygenase n=1 Tax=Pseudomonas sp. SJZ079 TaxID=2572887 RepID=UPI00119BB3AF|nr:FAD-dependent monooxygenase [Pseudomonas sp. SJZ079]TWC41621.1 2-polyprenyl-6-methoxyphenol hydroxylase-like FAD-dependent oxidoreductase [Pseudomonas sp. SJZ079]